MAFLQPRPTLAIVPTSGMHPIEPESGPLNAADLAGRLGLKQTSRRQWRGACPACGYGNDAFSVKAGDGGRALWWCASCQDGEAIANVLGKGHDDRSSRPPSVTTVTSVTGSDNKIARALRLWDRAQPLPGTAADHYLAYRGLAAWSGSKALRYQRFCAHPNSKGLLVPAMLAAVTNVDGAQVATHRTFIRSDGRGKANIEPTRASLGPVWGGAIRLCDFIPGQPLIIAEGIETALSAAILIGAPCWAAISAGNLSKGLILPAEVQDIIIAADPDEPGETAARGAWFRWRAEGRAARIATPNGSGDFNDILTGKQS